MHLDGVHTVWKLHFQFEQPSLPNSLILARYSTFPLLQVEGKSVLDRASDEAEWVIFAPLLAMMMRQRGTLVSMQRLLILPLFLQAGSGERHGHRLLLFVGVILLGFVYSLGVVRARVFLQ